MVLEAWAAKRYERNQTIAMLRAVAASLKENDSRLEELCRLYGQRELGSICPGFLDVSWWHGAVSSRIESIGEPSILGLLFAVFVCTDRLNRLLSVWVEISHPVSRAATGWSAMAEQLRLQIVTEVRKCKEKTREARRVLDRLLQSARLEGGGASGAS